MNTKYGFLPLLVISIILYILLEIYFLKLVDKEKFNYIFSSINIFILTALMVMIMGKNFSFFYILNFSRHSYLVSVVFIASTLLDICSSLFIIVGISKAYDLSIYKHKNKILNMQYNLQVNSIKQLESYQSDIRRINHDIYNHKNILYNLIKNKDYDDALDYLEQFRSPFNNNKEYKIYTNNKILNALFIEKEAVCLEHNIDFDLDVKLNNMVNILEFDLCIIIGNLIDNAIEACIKLDNTKKKYIKFKIKIINENLVIEITNSFNGFAIVTNNKFLTSKKDKLNHGLGLSNVKSTVYKYEGFFDLSFTDDKFTVLVMIPF